MIIMIRWNRFLTFSLFCEKRRQPAGELSGGQRQQVAAGCTDDTAKSLDA